MNALISQSLNLQNKLGLPDEALAIIQDGMRVYALGVLNAAKHPIEKREKPEMIRKFLEPFGLTFDGTQKVFK